MKWYLAHHGIQGQKWGVKNGPPYPLSKAKSKQIQSKSKDKSPKTSKNNKITKRYERGVKLTTKALRKLDTTTTGTINPNYLKTAEFRNKEVAAAMNTSYSGFVEGIKSVNTGAIYNTAKDIGAIEKNDNLGASMYKMDQKENFQKAASNANPFYGSEGYVNNCMHCGVATELRSRGYNVTAGYADKGASAFAFEQWFDGAKTKGYSSMEDMRRDLLKQGDGASGVMQGYFGDGIGSGMGGHTVHWSVEGRSLKIQDGQTGKSFNSLEEANTHYGFNTGGCFATRLDNAKPNWDNMAKRGVVGAPETLPSGFERIAGRDESDGYAHWYTNHAKRNS